MLVFTVPENAYPIVYARYVLGSIFVLFLPGYSLIKALFPTRELDNIERTALSIGMSLAPSPNNWTPTQLHTMGNKTHTNNPKPLALTTTFATTAIIREHQTKTSEAKTNFKG